MTKLKIKKESVNKPFTKDDGSKRDWFWTKALAIESDITGLAGCTFEFGGSVPHHEGEELDLDIEKQPTGRYKEIVEA